jgi:hypothetical protein
MYVVLVLAVISPASTIAAASKSTKLARCDGQHRRTANPYGSILPTVDPLTGAPAPVNQPAGTDGRDVFPQESPAPPKRPPNTAPHSSGPNGKTELQVPPISSASPTTAYRSC